MSKTFIKMVIFLGMFFFTPPTKSAEKPSLLQTIKSKLFDLVYIAHPENRPSVRAAQRAVATQIAKDLAASNALRDAYIWASAMRSPSVENAQAALIHARNNSNLVLQHLVRPSLETNDYGSIQALPSVAEHFEKKHQEKLKKCLELVEKQKQLEPLSTPDPKANQEKAKQELAMLVQSHAKRLQAFQLEILLAPDQYHQLLKNAIDELHFFRENIHKYPEAFSEGNLKKQEAAILGVLAQMAQLAAQQVHNNQLRAARMMKNSSFKKMMPVLSNKELDKVVGDHGRKMDTLRRKLYQPCDKTQYTHIRGQIGVAVDDFTKQLHNKYPGRIPKEEIFTYKNKALKEFVPQILVSQDLRQGISLKPNEDPYKGHINV